MSAHDLGRIARTALLAEAQLTPKPGLVDARGNGAHTDMDLATFQASAAALEPFFVEYAAAGMGLGAGSPAALADELRTIGIRAEAAMFQATGGVNTHKGANFGFALALGAVGALGAGGEPNAAEAFALVSRMGETLLDHDVRDLRRRERLGTHGLSHGERLMLQHGMQGARGEAARGYPIARKTLVPYLRERAESGCCATKQDVRVTLLRALVKAMAVLEDTNVVHRGGKQALALHRAHCTALDAAELPDSKLIDELERYDAELIRQNVSPGGAADLLSLSAFFAMVEGVIDPALLV